VFYIQIAEEVASFSQIEGGYQSQIAINKLICIKDSITHNYPLTELTSVQNGKKFLVCEFMP